MRLASRIGHVHFDGAFKGLGRGKEGKDEEEGE